MRINTNNWMISCIYVGLLPFACRNKTGDVYFKRGTIGDIPYEKAMIEMELRPGEFFPVSSPYILKDGKKENIQDFIMKPFEEQAKLREKIRKEEEAKKEKLSKEQIEKLSKEKKQQLANEEALRKAKEKIEAEERVIELRKRKEDKEKQLKRAEEFQRLAAKSKTTPPKKVVKK